MKQTSDNRSNRANRRTVLRTVAVGSITGAGITASSTSVTATPPEGAPSGNCDVLVDPSDPQADASTVQSGVDTASPKDTVCVAEDTYTEQVVINKDLTLTNVPGDTPTIEAPSSPTVFTSPDSGDWEPVVFAFGGSESGGNVSGPGTVDVNISGLTIDGQNRDSDSPVNILLRNVKPSGQNDKARVGDNRTTRTFVQPRTFGMVVEGNSALKIQDNEVDEYSRVGIFADGDEGAGPDPEVDIRGNIVTGPNRVDGSRDGNLTWAPNGIQVSSGATGKVRENTVENNWGPALGSGIIIVDSDGINVMQNSLSRNEVGIFFGKFFADDPVGNANIKRNDVFGGDNLPGEFEKMDYGTYLFDSNNSKVTNNDYDTWDNGILIAGGENNKVVNNSFTDVDEEVIDSGDDTKNPPNPANP